MGYGIAQWGKDAFGILYRTRDGKQWRVRKKDFAPGGRCNKGSLAFGPDNAAYCLFRDGLEKVMLGVGSACHPNVWEVHLAKVAI